MDVIENEQDLKTNNERLYPSDNWVKYLINYEGSTLDEYDLYKIENMLKNIYDHMPQMQDVINTLIMKGLKFQITVVDDPKNSKKSWYKNSYPLEIVFNTSRNITTERVLHELLHHFAANTCDLYIRGYARACEEYEVRFLTDLFMYGAFRGNFFEYQGLRSNDVLFDSYKKWVQDVLYDYYYPLDIFKKEFKKFGSFCILNINDANLNVDNLNSYIPQLVTMLWFDWKKN